MKFVDSTALLAALSLGATVAIAAQKSMDGMASMDANPAGQGRPAAQGGGKGGMASRECSLFVNQAPKRAKASPDG